MVMAITANAAELTAKENAIVYNGIAPPPDPGGVASGMPYLPGFEKMFLKSVG